jgi:hypothetical protein
MSSQCPREGAPFSIIEMRFFHRVLSFKKIPVANRYTIALRGSSGHLIWHSHFCCAGKQDVVPLYQNEFHIGTRDQGGLPVPTRMCVRIVHPSTVITGLRTRYPNPPFASSFFTWGPATLCQILAPRGIPTHSALTTFFETNLLWTVTYYNRLENM